MKFLIEIPINIKTDPGYIRDQFIKCRNFTEITYKEQSLFLTGTPVIPVIERQNPYEYLKRIFFPFTPDLIRDAKGFFYGVLFDPQNGSIIFFNSMFGILPLFFFNDGKIISISNNPGLLQKNSNVEPVVNRQFVLEQMLFNYPLFDSTPFTGINQVPSNSYLEIKDNKCNIRKHTHIDNFFSSDPIPWRNSKKNIADLFIQNIRDYFPDNAFQISFTSGFDGRTIVACAKHFDRNFSTYSFGADWNTDVTLPQKDARNLGISFSPLLLNNPNYIENEFWETGKKLVDSTGAMGNMVYTHFLYAAIKAGQNSEPLVNGFFGSELFRALHLTGAMTSPELVAFFRNPAGDSWIEGIRQSPKWKFLVKGMFKNELEETIESLKTFHNNYKLSTISRNQFFYIFVLEEIFRKFFGPLITAQMYYRDVYSPFLDFSFIKELLKTELAGANNPFFTHNPLMRIRGQIVYAEILKRTNHYLYYNTTGKGYRPADVLEPYRRGLILIPFISKRLKRRLKKENLDNLGLISAIEENRNNFERYFDFPYYSQKNLSDTIDKIHEVSEEDRDAVLKAASIGYFFNK